MSLADDLEGKSASYQARRPKVQGAVKRAFRKGIRTLQERMDSILRNMAYQGGFKSRAEARRWLDDPVSYTEVSMLLSDADALAEPERSKMLRLINRQSYAYRYNREKALRDLIEIHANGITRDIMNRTVPVMDEVAIESYGHSMFELQKGIGVGFAVEHIPVNMLERAVNSQLTFTRTIGYVKSVTIPMREALFEGILLGKSSGQIARDVQVMSGRSEWVSKAFARTALTEVSNEAEKRTLEDSGLKKYRFVATLDERTCPVCGRLDGQVFYLKDAQPGVNFPPMHRNCRCVHTAVLTDKARKDLKRRGRDAEGKDILVPQSMTYSEWQAKYMPKKGRLR